RCYWCSAFGGDVRSADFLVAQVAAAKGAPGVSTRRTEATTTVTAARRVAEALDHERSEALRRLVGRGLGIRRIDHRVLPGREAAIHGVLPELGDERLDEGRGRGIGRDGIANARALRTGIRLGTNAASAGGDEQHSTSKQKTAHDVLLMFPRAKSRAE